MILNLKNIKKNILVFLCLCSTFTYAQKPVLKAGSLISIENKKEIRAKNVNVGDLVAFDVSEDIKVGDSIVISKGAKAYAKVLVAKKSGIAGTKGKLKVEWLYCCSSANILNGTTCCHSRRIYKRNNSENRYRIIKELSSLEKIANHIFYKLYGDMLKPVASHCLSY